MSVSYVQHVAYNGHGTGNTISGVVAGNSLVIIGDAEITGPSPSFLVSSDLDGGSVEIIQKVIPTKNNGGIDKLIFAAVLHGVTAGTHTWSITYTDTTNENWGAYEYSGLSATSDTDWTHIVNEATTFHKTGVISRPVKAGLFLSHSGYDGVTNETPPTGWTKRIDRSNDLSIERITTVPEAVNTGWTGTASVNSHTHTIFLPEKVLLGGTAQHVFSPTIAGPYKTLIEDQGVGAQPGTLVGGLAVIADDGKNARRYRNRGRSFQLNGIDQYVDLGTGMTYGSITVAGWARSSSWNGALITKNDGESFAWDLSVDGTGRLFWGKDTYASRLSTTQTLNADQLHHIAATYDSATGDLKIFVDGQEWASGSVSAGDITSTAEPVQLGCRGDLGSPAYLEGELDDWRVWDRELTAEEISLLSFHGRGGETVDTLPGAECRICPSLDVAADGAGTTGYDLTGNNNNATLENSPLWTVDDGKLAFQFDATTNQKVNLSPFGYGTRGTDPFSAAVWFKSTGDNGANNPALTHEKNGSRSYVLIRLLSPSGFVNFQTAGAQYTGSDNLINDGKWHLAVAVFDGLSVYFYVDGNKVHGPDSYTAWTLGGTWCIGGSNRGSPVSFLGFVDDAQIFDRMLTASEIADMYHNGRGWEPRREEITQIRDEVVFSPTENASDSAAGITDATGQLLSVLGPSTPAPTINKEADGKSYGFLRTPNDTYFEDGDGSVATALTLGSRSWSFSVFLASDGESNLNFFFADDGSNSTVLGWKDKGSIQGLYIRAGANLGTRVAFYYPITPVANQWYHVVACVDYDAGTVRAWIDQVEQTPTQGVLDGRKNDNFTNTIIGADNYSGKLDQFRIFPGVKELSPQEIAILGQRKPSSHNRLMGSPKATADPDLQAYLRLNDNGDEFVTDSSGRARTCITRNPPVFQTDDLYSPTGPTSWMNESFYFTGGSIDLGYECLDIRALAGTLTGSDMAMLVHWKTDDDPATAGAYTGFMTLGEEGDRSHFPWTDGNVYCSIFRGDGVGTALDRVTFNPTEDLTQWRQLSIKTDEGTGENLYQFKIDSSVYGARDGLADPYVENPDYWMLAGERYPANNRYLTKGNIAGFVLFNDYPVDSEEAEYFAGPEPLRIGQSIPVISAPAIGTPCTVTPATYDAQSNGSVAYHYEWFIADDDEGNNTVFVSDAASYIPLPSDEGKYLRVREIPYNSGGIDWDQVSMSEPAVVASGTFSPSIRVGSTTVIKAYLGSTELDRIYIGDVELYSKT